MESNLRRIIYLIISILTFSSAYGSTLTTPSFIVQIEQNCEEGIVSCDDVTYTGKSKKNGSSITLKGKTLHSTCRDGSPCRFQGYEFKSGSITYRALEDGTLEVSKNGKTLVSEKGEWDW